LSSSEFGPSDSSRPRVFSYPDATVVCGKPQFSDQRQDTLENPVVILEVLAPSTEAFDRARKFESYRQIESLRAYVLIAQDHMHVEVFTKSPEGWTLSEASGKDRSLRVEFLDVSVPLSALYENVDFEIPQSALE
jgi:Uma2 family endonuclease